MKKFLFCGLVAMVASTYTFAGCIGAVVNGQCMGTYIDNPNIGSGSNRNGNNSGYESSSGARYQYDNSNPSDRLRYSTDLDAQRRDQMNLNPRRSLDRGTGQYGGGIYNDND